MLLTKPTIFLMDDSDAFAKTLIGFGRKRMNQLKRDMGYQNLTSGSNTVMLPSGYRVTATRDPGVNKVFILGPRRAADLGQVEYECFCNCNFALGQVREVNEVDGFNYLTVDSCKDDRYLRYEDVLASDFTPWRVDDVVMVMAYNEMLFDCDKNNFDATGCFPVIDRINEVAAENWRTTIRVLPICALTLPKWLKYARPV